MKELEGQISLFDQDIWFGKMSPEPLVQTTEKTLESYSKKQQKSKTKMPLFLDLRKDKNGQQVDVSWQTGGLLLGEYMMHSFGEYPSEEKESRLSQILEVNPHPKYCLSARACQGILNRANRRGKKLPEILQQALEQQITQSKLGGGIERDSNGRLAGKGALIQNELSGTLGVSQDQTLFQDVMGLSRERCGAIAADDLSPTIQAAAGESGNNQPMVSYAVESHAQDSRYNVGDINQTISGNMEHDSANGGLVLENHPLHMMGAAGFCTEHSADSRGIGYEEETSPTLRTGTVPAAVIENHPADSRVKISKDGTVQTLSSRMGTGGGNVPMVMENCNWDGEQTSPTLTSNNAGGNQRMPDKDNFNCVLSMQKIGEYKDTGVCLSIKQRDYKDATDLVCARDYKGVGNQFVDENKVIPQAVGSLCARDYKGYVVRRLTPLECERLQGFPSGWTDIGDWVDSKGKTHKGEADAPRYKALGNSIALPFWEWMIKRMAEYLPEGATMGSLFDGIGGFPLCSLRAGIRPLWNSEIESFPEAVTRVHFGDDDLGLEGDYERYL